MLTTPRILLAAFIGIAILAFGCSQADRVDVTVPALNDEEALARYNELSDEGYKFLDEGLLDSAIARFMEQETVIPGGKMSDFNMACAYARNDSADQAFEYLNKAADKGWDQTDYLEWDEDIQHLADDPRFETVLNRVKENKKTKGTVLAAGMPEFEQAPMQFATEEELDEWSQTESRKLGQNSRVWYGTEYLLARMEFQAKLLACQRELKKDDPEFDYGLERVRAASRIKSMYECWGSVTDAVIKETEAYLASPKTEAGANEANFRAAMAYSLQPCDDGPEKTISFTKALAYIDAVEEADEYYPAGQTLKLVNRIQTPGADEASFADEFRELTAQYGTDQTAKRIIGSRLGGDAAKLLWPIELGMNDIDGKMVNLANYSGKVLLIDFWATWCGPCLRELPNVREVYEKYHDQGLEILSISLDYEDRKPLADYRQWIAENGMTWKHIYDGKGWNSELAGKYFVASIPAAYLIGPDGSMAASGDDCRGEKLEESVKTALGI